MPKETPIKLSAYIVRVDAGFAPNPFGPTVRLHAASLWSDGRHTVETS